ncbi:MAG: hypothetical protein J5606_03265, partial [Bacteroidales bacterium]|nr:hypothetical protein [Bacteroidales bacterium]
TAKLNYLQSHYGTMDSAFLQTMLSKAPDSNTTISSYNSNDSAELFSLTNTWFASVPLTGDGARGCWSGLYPESYINGSYINLGFRPFTDIEEENDLRSGTVSAKTQKILSAKSTTKGQGTRKSMLDKVSKSRNFSLTYGAWIIGGSESEINNRVVRDVMDLNGDGYPDFINENHVYYSRHRGLNWDFSSPKTMNTDFYGSSSHTANDVFTATVMKMLDKVSHNANPNHTVSDYTGISQTSVIDETEYMLLDINGDGLPDLIYSDGMVKLNSGYAFDIEQHWDGLDSIGIYESKTFSANASAPSFPLANKKISKNCKWKASISGGIGFTLAKNEHIITLADLNGDGLPDLVHKNSNGSIRYRLNTGCGFDNVWRQWLMSVPAAWSTSASVNADVAVTGGFTFMSVFKVGGSVTARGGYSATSEYAQIADFDGDGLPDMLSIDNDDNLFVRYARLGRTGLLQTVTNPLGGSIVLDYEMTDANVYHSRRWVLKEVKLSDNLSGDGADTLTTRYGYQYGYYDHAERRFL